MKAYIYKTTTYIIYDKFSIDSGTKKAIAVKQLRDRFPT